MNQPPTWEQIVRRRRILALIVLAILVSVIWGGVNFVGQLFGGSSSGTPLAAGACAPGTVSVTVHIGDGKTDVSNFDSNTKAYMWFALTNNGKTACSFNAGPAVQFFTIKSGEEVIWTSEQCDRTGLTNQDITLTPGKEEVGPASEWKKVYSSGGGCGEGQASALSGSYTISANVNSVLSSNYVQFQLQ